MNRDQAYLNMLNASTKMQYNIAKILEAKAVEAERSSQWICNHFSVSSMKEHGERLKQTGEIHMFVLEVIDGLSRMENALAKNLKMLVRADEHEHMHAGGSGGLGNMFSLGDNEG
ncbi:hypothetical protein D3C73_733680 [compost metagenome]